MQCKRRSHGMALSELYDILYILRENENINIYQKYDALRILFLHICHVVHSGHARQYEYVHTIS